MSVALEFSSKWTSQYQLKTTYYLVDIDFCLQYCSSVNAVVSISIRYPSESAKCIFSKYNLVDCLENSTVFGLGCGNVFFIIPLPFSIENNIPPRMNRQRNHRGQIWQ